MASPEYLRLRARHPNHVFVILEKASRDAAHLPPLDKNKFIVGSASTVGQLLFMIRRRMSLPSETALFLFVGNVLPTASQTMGELQHLFASPDGFLRMCFTSEAVFGSSV